MNRREHIIAKMAEGERKLSALRTELDTTVSQLTALREELASLVPEEEDIVTLSSDSGHIMVDECHHCPAFSFERVLSEAKARYLTGFTATPQRRDGQHPIIEMQLGPARFVVSARVQNQMEPFRRRLVIRETQFTLGGINSDAGIQGIYAALAADQTRNDLIFDDVVAAPENKRSPILLTERRDHLEHFVERLKQFTRHLNELGDEMGRTK